MHSLYFSVGIHPFNVSDADFVEFKDKLTSFIAENKANKRMVAFGESGFSANENDI